jgi:hypothetical protein
MDADRKGVTLNELMESNRRLQAKVDELEGALRASRADSRRMASALASIRARAAEGLGVVK